MGNFCLLDVKKAKPVAALWKYDYLNVRAFIFFLKFGSLYPSEMNSKIF